MLALGEIEAAGRPAAQYAYMYFDKNLTCGDCHKDFTFTTAEQHAFAMQGFTNKPGRCPECRAARKANGGGGPSPGYRTRK